MTPTHPTFCPTCRTVVKHEVRYPAEQSPEDPARTERPANAWSFEAEFTCTQCGNIQWQDPALYEEA